MCLLSGWWQTLLRTGTKLRAHMLCQHSNYIATERLFPSPNLCRAERQTRGGEGWNDATGTVSRSRIKYGWVRKQEKAGQFLPEFYFFSFHLRFLLLFSLLLRYFFLLPLNLFLKSILNIYIKAKHRGGGASGKYRVL